MAANTISQLTTANTFQHWLTATQSLIGTANLLTDGAGSTFFANTRLEVGGSATSTLNVVTSATINDLIGNTSNITTSNTVSLQARNLNHFDFHTLLCCCLLKTILDLFLQHISLCIL